MTPMAEEHFAVLCQHMVEAIAIHADLLAHELGKPALDARMLETPARRYQS